MVIADPPTEHPSACNAARVVKTGLACLLTLFSVAAWTLGAQATAGASTTCDLYASNSGSDSNPGTPSAPLRTLKKLLTSLAAGQTGCLMSGQTFDGEPDSTGNGSIVVRGGETHGAEGAPVTITSTDPSNPAVISHSVTLEGGADWITFTHLKFDWAQPGQCSWTAEGNPYNCPAEDHVQIAVSSKHSSWTWDEITSKDTNICVNLVGYNGSTAEYTLIEHDRIHDCGTPVTNAHPTVNEEPGWHEHGIYDYGNFTTIRNDYIYNSSRDGVLLYPQGNGAVVEHNVIDSNGAGVSLAGVANVIVRWNIITNAYSPRGYDEDGMNSNGAGVENLAEHNCLYNNPSGEIDVSIVTMGVNLTGTNPLYVNAVNHNYSLEPTSSCVGYGPDTAQPTTSAPTETTPPPTGTTSAPTETTPAPIAPAPTGGTTSAPPGTTPAPPGTTSAPTGTTPAPTGTTPAPTGTTTTKKGGGQKRPRSAAAIFAQAHPSEPRAMRAKHRRHARRLHRAMHRRHAGHRRRAKGVRRHTRGR